MLFVPPIGLIIIGFLAHKADWIFNRIVGNKFYDFISTISYGLYLYHVFYRDIRTRGELDIRLKYGPADYPITLGWFTFDILSNYIMFIPIAWLSEKFFEVPLNDVGNKIANKISKGLKYSRAGVFLGLSATLMVIRYASVQ